MVLLHSDQGMAEPSYIDRWLLPVANQHIAARGR
jgi:hypothetical protein